MQDKLLNEYEKKISVWYKKHIKFLNIIAPPFESTCIFQNIIKEIYMNQGKILYVWGKEAANQELKNCLKKRDIDIKCSYIKRGKLEKGINFVCYKNLKNIEISKEEAELAVFDDLSSYNMITAFSMNEYIDFLGKICRKVIIFSMEKAQVIGEKMMFPSFCDQPFLEPRVITTRIDLNKDIPFSVYDYLKFFYETKTKTLVLAKNKKRADEIYDYFLKSIKFPENCLIKITEKNEARRLNHVLKHQNRALFIISIPDIDIFKNYEAENLVVLNADDDMYNYKKLLFLCGALQKSAGSSPEALLVSNSVTAEMDKAKDIARNFNKVLWERCRR